MEQITIINENFIAGLTNVVCEANTLLSGENVDKFTLMGKVTVSEKLIPCTSSADDGSEVPYGIAITDLDATEGDKAQWIYVKGEFREDMLVLLGTGDTVETFRDDLKGIGIYLHKAV